MPAQIVLSCCPQYGRIHFDDEMCIRDSLIIVGTLNKESYSTRGGREHLTIVKAKYIGHLNQDTFTGRLDSEATKGDSWSHELVVSIADLVRDMLIDVGEQHETDGETLTASS